MSAHTPGPWKNGLPSPNCELSEESIQIYCARHILVVPQEWKRSRGKTIAKIAVTNKADINVAIANARLIAAAPDLLEALTKARRELHACQAVIHLVGGFDPAYVNGAQAALKDIDGAIAKATGENK